MTYIIKIWKQGANEKDKQLGKTHRMLMPDIFSSILRRKYKRKKPTNNHGFIRYFFNKALLFCFTHMKVKAIGKMYS